MTDFLRLHRLGMQAWFDNVETSLAVWTTLAHRLPMLATAQVSAQEGNRMVAEKFEAAARGALDASCATMAFAARAALTAQPPAAFAVAAMNIAEAAMLPARRSVAANAKRLSRPKARQSRS